MYMEINKEKQDNIRNTMFPWNKISNDKEWQDLTKRLKASVSSSMWDPGLISGGTFGWKKLGSVAKTMVFTSPYSPFA